MWTAGIDLGGSKVAVSIFHAGTLQAIEVYSAKRSKLGRSGDIYNVATRVNSILEDHMPQRGPIFIEEPLVGRGVRASLQIAQMCGGVMALVRDRSSCPIYLVPVATWKKKVVGKGNATKEDVRAWLQSTHLDYAVLLGNDQDKYDAVCIGIYGQLIATQAADMEITV